jgi:hypothetical protein
MLTVPHNSDPRHAFGSNTDLVRFVFSDRRFCCYTCRGATPMDERHRSFRWMKDFEWVETGAGCCGVRGGEADEGGRTGIGATLRRLPWAWREFERIDR